MVLGCSLSHRHDATVARLCCAVCRARAHALTHVTYCENTLRGLRKKHALRRAGRTSTDISQLCNCPAHIQMGAL
jgi:hypothetical protein